MTGSKRTQAKRRRKLTLTVGVVGVVLAAIGLIYIATHAGCV